MRDGRLERHEQAGLHHRQAHRYPGRGETLCERAEGAEGLDGGVGPDALEAAHDLAAALGREVALDVADGEDEHAQQDDDLYRVVDEEVERAAQLTCRVDSECPQHGGDQFAQPLHLQYLVQDKRPDGSHICSFHINI